MKCQRRRYLRLAEQAPKAHEKEYARAIIPEHLAERHITLSMFDVISPQQLLPQNQCADQVIHQPLASLSCTWEYSVQLASWMLTLVSDPQAGLDPEFCHLLSRTSEVLQILHSTVQLSR